jgi:predicted NBD/HSP70 family sugar kinase
MDFIRMSQTGNSKNQYRINKSLIFNYLLRHGPSYKTQVAEALAISLPAISRVFDSLEQAGFIEEAGIRRSPNGRSVPYYQASIKDGYIVGADLLKMKLAIRLLSANQEFIISDLDFDESAIQEGLEKSINLAVDRELESGRIKHREDLKALCVGSPGIVDTETGEIRTAVFHKGLNHLNLMGSLEKAFGKPVLVDNVVKLSAFAEYQNIDNPRVKNLLCIDLGFEVGVGVIIEGHVFRGQNCRAGEIGFGRTTYDEAAISDSLYAKSLSFVWLGAQAKEKLGIESRYDDYSAKDENLKVVVRLFQMAEDGDRTAREIIDEYTKRLAVLVNNLHYVLDPDLILLSGDICVVPGSQEWMVSSLRKAMAKISYFDPPEIRMSKYGSNSALIGACDNAFDTYIKTEFPYSMR